jgi:hypothetical protein
VPESPLFPFCGNGNAATVRAGFAGHALQAALSVSTVRRGATEQPTPGNDLRMRREQEWASAGAHQ